MDADGATLTPIGLLQRAAKDIAGNHLRGCQHLATVAVVLDVESGFTPPRHLGGRKLVIQFFPKKFPKFFLEV